MTWARCAAWILVGGCSFSGAPGSEDVDPPGEIELVDTMFAEGTRGSTSITSTGALEPTAYATNGLRARGYTGFPNGDPYYILEADTYAALEQVLAPHLRGTAYYRAPDAGSQDPPPNLTLGNDRFIILFDGEIELAEGPRELRIAPDDVVRIEIGPPDAPVVSLFSTFSSGERTASFEGPPGGGWVPIRIAFEEVTGSSGPGIRLDGAPLDPARLRTAVSDHRGLQVRGARDYYTTVGEAVVDAIDASFSNRAPVAFPDAGDSRYGLRYVGQILVDTAGPHQFDVVVPADGTDTASVRIDGERVARAWYGSQPPPTPVTLSAGWHDLVVDYANASGDGSIRLVGKGPRDDAFAGIPNDHVRPVAMNGLSQLLLDTDDVGIAAGATEVLSFTPALPAGATVSWDDVFVQFNSEVPADLGLAYVGCQQVPFPLAVGVRLQYFDGAEACAGTSPATVGIEVRPASAITVDFAGLFTTYRGGPSRRPFVDQPTFVSRVLETPEATRLISLAVAGTFAEGQIRAYVRSGDDLASAAWVEVPAEGVPAVDVPLGDQTQYQIVAETEGWDGFTVDSVTLTYAAP